MKKTEENNYYEAVFNSDLIDIFEKFNKSSIDSSYIDRETRNQFAAKQIKTGLPIKKILNIGGGGNRHLASSINDKNISVTEIDIEGDCDLKINLDHIGGLPFNNDSFDAVCAFDVLEHLENFHLINEEIFRVSKNYVLISLPNSAAEILFNPLKNIMHADKNIYQGVYSKFYGLPLKIPNDRHRWWLYFQDIIRFYYLFSLEKKVKIEFWVPKPNLKKRLFRLIFGKHIYYTFFCWNVWIKIYKDPDAVSSL